MRKLGRVCLYQCYTWRALIFNATKWGRPHGCSKHFDAPLRMQEAPWIPTGFTLMCSSKSTLYGQEPA